MFWDCRTKILDMFWDEEWWWFGQRDDPDVIVHSKFTLLLIKQL